MTPLEGLLSTHRGLPARAVHALLSAWPVAAAITAPCHRRLPLHSLLLRDAGTLQPDVLALLLAVHPGAAAVLSRRGLLPLHYAVRLAPCASSETIEALLAANAAASLEPFPRRFSRGRVDVDDGDEWFAGPLPAIAAAGSGASEAAVRAILLAMQAAEDAKFAGKTTCVGRITQPRAVPEAASTAAPSTVAEARAAGTASALPEQQLLVPRVKLVGAEDDSELLQQILAGEVRDGDTCSLWGPPTIDDREQDHEHEQPALSVAVLKLLLQVDPEAAVRNDPVTRATLLHAALSTAASAAAVDVILDTIMMLAAAARRASSDSGRRPESGGAQAEGAALAAGGDDAGAAGAGSGWSGSDGGPFGWPGAHGSAVGRFLNEFIGRSAAADSVSAPALAQLPFGFEGGPRLAAVPPPFKSYGLLQQLLFWCPEEEKEPATDAAACVSAAGPDSNAAASLARSKSEHDNHLALPLHPDELLPLQSHAAVARLQRISPALAARVQAEQRFCAARTRVLQWVAEMQPSALLHYESDHASLRLPLSAAVQVAAAALAKHVPHAMEFPADFPRQPLPLVEAAAAGAGVGESSASGTGDAASGAGNGGGSGQLGTGFPAVAPYEAGIAQGMRLIAAALEAGPNSPDEAALPQQFLPALAIARAHGPLLASAVTEMLKAATHLSLQSTAATLARAARGDETMGAVIGTAWLAGASIHVGDRPLLPLLSEAVSSAVRQRAFQRRRHAVAAYALARA